LKYYIPPAKVPWFQPQKSWRGAHDHALDVTTLGEQRIDLLLPGFLLGI
jgi:hypothetical protein